MTKKVQALIKAEVKREEIIKKDIDLEDDLYIAKGILRLKSKQSYEIDKRIISSMRY